MLIQVQEIHYSSSTAQENERVRQFVDSQTTRDLSLAAGSTIRLNLHSKASSKKSSEHEEIIGTVAQKTALLPPPPHCMLPCRYELLLHCRLI